jgi:hypothetical protein
MANAGRFFASAIPSPGGDPITTGDHLPPEAENAPFLRQDWSDLDINEVERVDLSEHRAVFEGKFRERGWDAVAVYAPFHRHGPSLWGIYFLGDPFLGAVDVVQSRMAETDALRSQAWLFKALHEAVLTHELFHFRVEWAATHAEVVTGSESLYNSYLTLGRHDGLVEAALTEEAIATAEEIHRAQRIDPALASALSELSNGLPGYGDFRQYLGGEAANGHQFVMSNLSGKVSTGELLGKQNAWTYHRSIPVRWILPRIKVDRLYGLLLRIFSLSIRDVVRDARRRTGVTVEASGGTHPLKIRVEGKRPVPLSRNWSDQRVPEFVVKQLAALFDLSPGDYCAQVMR